MALLCVAHKVPPTFVRNWREIKIHVSSIGHILKLQVKLPPPCLIKHHLVKTYRRVGLCFHAFLTLALELLNSLPDRCITMFYKNLRTQITNVYSRIHGGTQIRCACGNHGIQLTDGVGRSALPMIQSKTQNGGLRYREQYILFVKWYWKLECVCVCVCVRSAETFIGRGF
jgi:hypothetical protein